MEERLQKIIARAGLTSRRAAEEFITAGRVRVNGRIITELGAKADPRKDRIEVDGTRLVSEPPVYVVLHKPKNVVSTMSDPEGRPTVAEYVRNVGARVYPIGRLDFATSGVLLMTNDGDFSNALLHPKGGVPKKYIVKVHGVMDEDDVTVWRKGVELEDGKTLPAEVMVLRHEGDKTWLEVTLREGRNQQIRRMGEATRFPVMRLARTDFAGVTSEGLLPGKWRLLTVDELMEIRKQFGVPKRVRAAADGNDLARLENRPRRPSPTRARNDEGPSKRQGSSSARNENRFRNPRVRSDEPTSYNPRTRVRSDEPTSHNPRTRVRSDDSAAPKPRARVRSDEPTSHNPRARVRSDDSAAPKPRARVRSDEPTSHNPRARVRSDEPASPPRPSHARPRKERSAR